MTAGLVARVTFHPSCPTLLLAAAAAFTKVAGQPDVMSGITKGDWQE